MAPHNANLPDRDLGLALDAALPVPEIYYDGQGGGRCFYMRNERGNFIPMTIADVKRRLKRMGVSDERGKNQFVSEMDALLDDVIKKADVDYAGPLAGYTTGAKMIQNRRVLVTEPPHFVEATEGEWATWAKVLDRMLVPPAAEDPEFFAGNVPNDRHVGKRQLDTLYSWGKLAMSTLRAGKRRPGQVLVIAGPHGCGKSLLQNMITKMLGGRSAKPYQYMTGGTQFNSELFTAEHLMIEDEAALHDFKARMTLSAKLKEIVANPTQRCHPKGRQALTLMPFWRASITLNDGAEDLLVLPLLTESVQDKVILLRAFAGKMPMETETMEQWSAFEALLDAELPHFIHFLLHKWQIPEAMRDGRYGVKHYHHPDLLQMMSLLSPEAKLLELVDARLWGSGSGQGTLGNLEDWGPKRASDLEALLTEKDSSTAYEARKLLAWNSACGQYLARLEKQFPGRVICRGTYAGYTRWVIKPPPVLEDEGE